ncbi:glycosyltransferase family protein [Schaalia sp. Marseille-Q2122]|uniref:glycosyltransferase family protein n=1 Tax=Schaalia sp. Marseille-Q2122 TaxID=2736604 RepID=UPI00158DF1E6|nr:glycosyltransferase [Schaalia sp. Marseille-Q2122]
MSEDPIKVVLYSHDSQGLGHVRRNLAIAHHLANTLPVLSGRPVSGLLVSGIAPTMRFPLPEGFDWVTIPGIAKGKHGYQARSLATKTGSLIHLRSQLIEATLLSFAPDIVVVDRHIYGVWNELRGPLEKLRATHPHSRVVLGLREILDEPHIAAAEWEALGDPDLMRGLVDEVWAYGDPKVHSLIASGEAPAALQDRIRFTGYLAHGRRVTDSVQAHLEGPYILTTAGGGSDGLALLTAAVQAKVPAPYRHLVVTGPQMSDEDYEKIRELASPHTEILRSLPGLGLHISHASAVIAMGGYNTACEILATDTPALIVPREEPRKEQLIRAQALHAVGGVDYLRTVQLSPAALADWMSQVAGHSIDRSSINRDGLSNVPRLACALIAQAHEEDTAPCGHTTLTPALATIGGAL